MSLILARVMIIGKKVETTVACVRQSSKFMISAPIVEQSGCNSTGRDVQHKPYALNCYVKHTTTITSVDARHLGASLSEQ